MFPKSIVDGTVRVPAINVNVSFRVKVADNIETSENGIRTFSSRLRFEGGHFLPAPVGTLNTWVGI